MTITAASLRLYPRWMIQRDFQEVLAIERAVFAQPWTEDEFLTCLRQRNCIGWVAEALPSEEILGFMVLELHPDQIELLNLAVRPDARRLGVGRAMLEKLRDRLSSHRRERATAIVSDANLPAQMFFRACRWRAVEVMRGHFDDGSDGYVMEARR